MKVREIITIKGWINGSGWSYNQTYSDNVIEIDALPEDFSDFDDEWRNGWTHNDTEDTRVSAAYYAVDDDELETPLAEFEAWASELGDNEQ